MVAAVEFKRHVAYTCILGIVVYKFSHWQEVYPVILSPVYKRSEVYLHYAILFFCLTIDLKMESNGEFFLNFQEVAQQKPEF